MTDAARATDERRAGFEVAPSTIPVGVRCRSCGRLHLPARLWPVAITPSAGAGTEVELRCVRCNAVGSLLLDDARPEHRGLLSVWRDQTPGDGDNRGSA